MPIEVLIHDYDVEGMYLYELDQGDDGLRITRREAIPASDLDHLFDQPIRIPEGGEVYDCEHGPNEEHTICVVCGECREDLNEGEECGDCRD